MRSNSDPAASLSCGVPERGRDAPGRPLSRVRRDEEKPEKAMEAGERAYGFRLADGSRWKLTGSGGAGEWLDELARILGCGAAPETPTHAIHFRGVKDLLAPRRGPGFAGAGNGWRCFEHGGIHRVWRHPDRTEAHIELHETFLDHPEIRYINMWSALREVHRHALFNGGTPVHATLAALNGRGVLIAGPGGAGKSTCYARLPDEWERLCDDRALMVRTPEGGYRAHPLPTWSDHLWRASERRWDVERSVPLTAIFFLEQAPKDEATPLKDPAEAVLEFLDAARQVWQPLWSRLEGEERRAQSSLLFDNVSRAARAVPAYRLRATLRGRFWEEMERKIHD